MLNEKNSMPKTMKSCQRCDRKLLPVQEYQLKDRELCEDCCIEERLPTVRKTHWQYVKSIKDKYLIKAKEKTDTNNR